MFERRFRMISAYVICHLHFTCVWGFVSRTSNPSGGFSHVSSISPVWGPGGGVSCHVSSDRHSGKLHRSSRFRCSIMLYKLNNQLAIFKYCVRNHKECNNIVFRYHILLIIFISMILNMYVQYVCIYVHLYICQAIVG